MKWLARIPGAPQIFDAALLAVTGLFDPNRVRAMSVIESTVREWSGMRVRVHRFGGMGFFFQGRESSHIHGNGLLDCFVGGANRDELVASGRAMPHHVFPDSGWISFWIEDEDHIQHALELIRVANASR